MMELIRNRHSHLESLRYGLIRIKVTNSGLVTGILNEWDSIGVVVSIDEKALGGIVESRFYPWNSIQYIMGLNKGEK